jgi:folate-binding protein YgfZ
MTPLPYLAVLQVEGSDAEKFLQSQTTAHLTGLHLPAATFSAFCTAKGKVIATCLITPRADHWFVIVETSLLEKLIRTLQTFILREDVTLVPRPDLHMFRVSPHDFRVPGLASVRPRTLPMEYAMVAMNPDVDPEATASWRRAELLWGIAWLNEASSEKYIPQMLGLDEIGAVSFSKGCYPGQEIIARARHLGEVKRHPQVLDITGPKPPNASDPCYILTPTREIDANVVHCVSNSRTHFTVMTISALQAEEVVEAVEQGGQLWTAKRAQKDY